MALEVKALTRVFQYNGLDLADIDPTLSPGKVKDVYSHMYPELSTAEIEDLGQQGDRLVYKFKRSAGTKGAALSTEVTPVPFVERLAALAAGQPDPANPDVGMQVTPSWELLNAAARFRAALTATGTPVVVPSTALSLLL